MRSNTIVLIVVLIVIAAVYGFIWPGQLMDWFRSPTIQVLAQIRPVRSVRSTPGEPATYPVSFAFDRKLKITEIKVVAVEDEKTNKFPHAVWHMISDSNSVPTKAMIYGQPLRGLKPKVPRARPEPLEADVKYRFYVTAGKYKGQRDFKTIETAEAASQ